MARRCRGAVVAGTRSPRSGPYCSRWWWRCSLAGLISALWIATPCQTFASARDNPPSPPPLRSNMHIVRFPGLSSIDAQAVKNGNPPMHFLALLFSRDVKLNCASSPEEPASIETVDGTTFCWASRSRADHVRRHRVLRVAAAAIPQGCSAVPCKALPGIGHRTGLCHRSKRALPFPAPLWTGWYDGRWSRWDGQLVYGDSLSHGAVQQCMAIRFAWCRAAVYGDSFRMDCWLVWRFSPLGASQLCMPIRFGWFLEGQLCWRFASHGHYSCFGQRG